MLPDIETLTQRIERERKERERELLALLLLLFEGAYRRARNAVEFGLDPFAAARDAVLGNMVLMIPGGIERLAQQLAEAEAEGYARVQRMLGVRITRIEVKPNGYHRGLAHKSLSRALGRLQVQLYLELGRTPGRDAKSRQKAVRAAFEGSGLVMSATSKAWLLENEATAIGTLVYAGGMQGGYARPDVVAVLTGLRFVNPLDERTTGICRSRHGVILPLDHPWWFTNWPPLHFGCRSIVLPLTRKVKFTENPPASPAPDLGWGHWVGILSAVTA